MQSRLIYRARQFWKTISASEKSVPDSGLSTSLSKNQTALFRRMHPSEQLHAYRVYQKLVKEGWDDRDLLSAALLHDIGKILHPLSPVDRVVIVLGKWLFPGKVSKWAGSAPSGFQRPFVVARKHPEWGAMLAEKEGASALTVEIIRRHQDTQDGINKKKKDTFLSALQAADNEF